MFAGMSKKKPDQDRATRLGQKIRALRKRAGLTQEQLGGLAGVSRLTIGNIETGDTEEPSRAVVDGIAEALKTTRFELESDNETAEIAVEGVPASDPSASVSPLLGRYFGERDLLDEEKEFLAGVGTLRYRDQALSFEILDGIVAALRRSNPSPAPSGKRG